MCDAVYFAYDYGLGCMVLFERRRSHARYNPFFLKKDFLIPALILFFVRISPSLLKAVCPSDEVRFYSFSCFCGCA